MRNIRFLTELSMKLFMKAVMKLMKLMMLLSLLFPLTLPTTSSRCLAADPNDPNDQNNPLSGVDDSPDEPIGELKRPAGSGDDYPGDDQLFEEKESKSGGEGGDADVPDTSGFSPEERRQLSEFRLGPTAALGLPHPLTYGLEFLQGGLFGRAFTLGTFNTKVSDAKVSLSSWDIRVRWFPWRSAWFGGLAFGQQKASGEIKKDAVDGGAVGKFDATMKLTAKTSYATPHVGWSSTWESGFTMGFEVGLQVPLSSKEEFSAKFAGNLTADQEAQIKAGDDYKKLDSDAKEVAKKIGSTVLPHLTLVKVGWLF